MTKEKIIYEWKRYCQSIPQQMLKFEARNRSTQFQVEIFDIATRIGLIRIARRVIQLYPVLFRNPIQRTTHIVPNPIAYPLTDEEFDDLMAWINGEKHNEELIEVENEEEKQTPLSSENKKDMCVCKNCGGDAFYVFVTTIIDDARLYCVSCHQEW